MPQPATGYEAVEYIESDGGQYIDTGLKPDSGTEIVIDIEPQSGDTAPFFGARTEDSGIGSQSFGAWIIGGEWVDSPYYRIDYGDNKQTIDTSNVQNRVEVRLKNGAYSIGGASGTVGGGEISPANNLLLLTTWDIYGEAPDSRMMRGRLYWCRIYQNGALIRDYVPCVRMSDNEPGLYDLSGGRFYENAGSGSFDSPGLTYVPKIESAAFSENPAPAGKKITLIVRVTEEWVILMPELWYSGEIYSGEV